MGSLQNSRFRDGTFFLVLGDPPCETTPIFGVCQDM